MAYCNCTSSCTACRQLNTLRPSHLPLPTNDIKYAVLNFEMDHPRPRENVDKFAALGGAGDVGSGIVKYRPSPIESLC